MSKHAIQTTCISHKTGPLNGYLRIPGDKSISHRSIMFGALAQGETIVSGLLEGDDVMNTAHAMNAMGAHIQKSDDGLWRIQGTGQTDLKNPDLNTKGLNKQGLIEPTQIIDMGNSGTSTRLIMGILAGYDFAVTLTGDASLIKRPMARVITPLQQMGATFLSRSNNRLPLTMKGSSSLKAIEYTLPVASAQVKSAIILAGLRANGTTTVIEPEPTRDHSENMLRHFGIPIQVENIAAHAQAIHVPSGGILQGCAIDVPSDPSSAAFPTVAALLSAGSELKMSRMCINPRRTGLYQTLQEMGADITFEHERLELGEQTATMTVRGGTPLKGIDVPPERVASMIDEFPILAVAAACAHGTTRMTNLAELRVKESDRLAMMAKGLQDCGVKLEKGADSLTIHGTGNAPTGGAFIETALDHRIAMSFLILGTVTEEPITIDDISPINTSFPHFIDMMNDIGARFSPQQSTKKAS